MSRAAKSSQAPLCVVQIGFQQLLLPIAKGLKVIELLQGAAEVELAFDEGRVYRVGKQPRIELTTVQPSDIEWPEAPPQPGRSPAQRALLLPAPIKRLR